MKLWREVFPDFGVDPSKVRKEMDAPDEQFIHEKHPSFSMAFGSHHAQIRTHSQAGDEIKRTVIVERHKKLTFKVETNVEPPFDVYWKVKNTGPEARKRDTLRGEITKGGSTRDEPVAFAGNHWVEAYIVKNDQVHATARKDMTFLGAST